MTRASSPAWQNASCRAMALIAVASIPIESARTGDLIRFAATLSGQTITLAGKQLSLSVGVTIDSSDLQKGVTIDGGKGCRVFSVAEGIEVSMVNLRICGGVTTASGGGIRNAGTLKLTGCAVVDNSAARGGGIESSGELTLINCTVAGNTSKNTYAATPPLTEAQQYLGSGIYNIKTLNVYNSIIALNAKGGNLATSSTATSRGYYVLAPNAEWTSSESAFEYDSSLPLFKADPLFSAGGVLLNPDQADLALAPYSQAVDAGNVGYVQGTVDLAGNSRTNGSAADLGAYEY